MAQILAARGSDYARLSRLVRERGLLRRRPGYYTTKMIVEAVLFAGGWTAFAVVGDSWWQLVVAAYLGLVWTHVAFLGHDIGHKQVFTRRRAVTVAGLVCGNLAIGVSRGWWVDKHNRHHGHPNQVGQDPDIGAGVIVPAGAVLLQGGKQAVFVQVEAGVFEPRTVEVGWQGPGEVLVTRGLASGEQVVAENTLLLTRQYGVNKQDKGAEPAASAAATAQGDAPRGGATQ